MFTQKPDEFFFFFKSSSLFKNGDGIGAFKFCFKFTSYIAILCNVATVTWRTTQVSHYFGDSFQMSFFIICTLMMFCCGLILEQFIDDLSNETRIRHERQEEIERVVILDGDYKIFGDRELAQDQLELENLPNINESKKFSLDLKLTVKVTFESVTEMMDHWESAFTAGDFSIAASVYEENATLTVLGMEYTSSAEIENFFKKFYNGVSKYTITAKTSTTMQGTYDFGAYGIFDYEISFNPATNKIITEVVTAKSISHVL